jgi:group I intron endonuclease
MKLCGIYKIQSKKKPERIYVGSSVHIYSRWGKHRGDLSRNKHENGRLQNHVNKYGLDDLVFSIITGCSEDVTIAYEQFYIDALNPWFNLAPIAGTTRGIIHESRRGIPVRPAGSKLTEEHKRKISEAMRGAKNHQYGKPSPRKGMKGNPNPYKGIKGRYSEETLQKMRISNQRAWDRRKQKQKEETLCQASE